MVDNYEDELTRLRRHKVRLAVRLATEGRWQEAVEANQSILKLFPEDAETYNRLGKAYAELGRFAEARRAYQRALEIEPNNTIAQKNSSRLAHISVDMASVEPKEKVDPRLFLEEIGKTGVTMLMNPGEKEVLAELSVGDIVYLKPSGRHLLVENAKGEHLGQVEPKLGKRLLGLMEGGNKYTAAVISLEASRLKVFIREIEQHPSQAGRISFPPKPPEPTAVRPYTKGRLLHYEAEDEEEEIIEEGEPEKTEEIVEAGYDGESEEE